jgi:hypothetical protein
MDDEYEEHGPGIIKDRPRTYLEGRMIPVKDLSHSI